MDRRASSSAKEERLTSEPARFATDGAMALPSLLSSVADCKLRFQSRVFQPASHESPADKSNLTVRFSELCYWHVNDVDLLVVWQFNRLWRRSMPNCAWHVSRHPNSIPFDSKSTEQSALFAGRSGYCLNFDTRCRLGDMLVRARVRNDFKSAPSRDRKHHPGDTSIGHSRRTSS
jgi:hypothetical protein